MGVRQRPGKSSDFRQPLVKSEYLPRPWRRTQHGDVFLQRLQSGKVDGIILEIDDGGRKRRRPDDAMGHKISEDSQDLASIASERLDVESVANAAVACRSDCDPLQYALVTSVIESAVFF